MNYKHKLYRFYNNKKQQNYLIIISETKDFGKVDFAIIDIKNVNNPFKLGLLWLIEKYRFDDNEIIIYNTSLMKKKVEGTLPAFYKHITGGLPDTFMCPLNIKYKGDQGDKNSIAVFASAWNINIYELCDKSFRPDIQQIISDFNTYVNHFVNNKGGKNSKNIHNMVMTNPTSTIDNVIDEYNVDYIYYTDASVNDNTGYSVSTIINPVTQDNCSIIVNGKDSNSSNAAELFGVYHVAMSIPEGKTAVIFTDSKSVVDCINNFNFYGGTWTHKKNSNKHNPHFNWVHSFMLMRLSDMDNITVKWVKGHDKNYYNCVADTVSRGLLSTVNQNGEFNIDHGKKIISRRVMSLNSQICHSDVSNKFDHENITVKIEYYDNELHMILVNELPQGTPVAIH